MRSFLFVIQYFFYLSYNLLLIFYYLFIGESDYVESHSAKTFGPAEVFFLLVWLGMIATINLYYQLPFKANKINNKTPNDMLPAKMKRFWKIPQCLPENSLCICHLHAVLSRKFFQDVVSVGR